MSVLKRDVKTSKNDLVIALDEFCQLLLDQKENEAVEILNKAKAMLSDDSTSKDAISSIIDCFDGEQELNAYTLHKQSENWTVADQLSFYSTRVLTLAKRMSR